MKAITLWQPWASLIAVGAKQYETRPWKTNYRGRIAIHAARRKVIPPSDVMKVMKEHGLKINELKYGVIVCTAELVDCVKLDRNTPIMEITIGEEIVGDWSHGRYAWKLEDIKVLDTPLAVTGFQKLWNLDNHLIQEDCR